MSSRPIRTTVLPATFLAGVAALTPQQHAQATPSDAHRTDQIIVHFDRPPADGDLRALGLSQAINQTLRHVREMADGSNVYKLDTHQSLNQVRGLARALEAVSGVRYAEADQLFQPNFSAPNDSHYDLQWHYHQNLGGIDAPAAWAQFSSAPATPVYVAVLDTGFRPHVDLVGNLIGGADLIADNFVANDGDGRDMDASDPGDWYLSGECGGPGSSNSSWHGTHVAGTIAAQTNNGSGVSGVSYNMAKVIPVRVLGKCGGYLSDIADGIRWAAGQSVSGVSNNPYPASIINMSLGGSGSCGTTYQSAIDSARSQGASIIVSAGNANTDAADFRPANCDNVITVAANAHDGSRSYYSNYGEVVDISAPGGEMNVDGTLGIASTLNSGTTTPGNDNYVYYQGTSMASPHVAGVIALMLAKDPSLTPDQVQSLLLSSARPFPSGCVGCGVGIADAGAAVSALDGSTIPTLPSQPQIQSTLDNQNGTASIVWSDSDTETGYQLQRQKKNKKRWGSWGDIAYPQQDQIDFLDNSGTGTFKYRLRATNNLGSSDWSVSDELVVTDGSESSGGGGGGGGNSDKPCRGRNC